MLVSSHFNASAGVIPQLVGHVDNTSTIEKPLPASWVSKAFLTAFLAWVICFISCLSLIHIFGKVNFVEGSVVASRSGQVDVDVWGQVITVEQQQNLQAGTRVKLVLRPEAIHLGDDRGYAKGVISNVVYLGSSVEYNVLVQEKSLMAVASSPLSLIHI